MANQLAQLMDALSHVDRLDDELDKLKQEIKGLKEMRKSALAQAKEIRQAMSSGQQTLEVK